MQKKVKKYICARSSRNDVLWKFILLLSVILVSVPLYNTNPMIQETFFMRAPRGIKFSQVNFSIFGSLHNFKYPTKTPYSGFGWEYSSLNESLILFGFLRFAWVRALDFFFFRFLPPVMSWESTKQKASLLLTSEESKKRMSAGEISLLSRKIIDPT